MKWLDAIRDWFVTNETEERSAFSSSRSGTSEVLEFRLVLGSLSTDSSVGTLFNSEQTASAGSGKTETASNVVAQSNASSSTLNNLQSTASTVSPADLQADTDSAGSKYQDATDAALSDTPLAKWQETSTTSGHETALASTTLESVVLPEYGNTTSTSQLSAPGASPASNGPGRTTQSTPLVPPAPANTSSPPVALDRALTAINSNVMVTSEELAAAKTGGASSVAPLVVPAWFSGQTDTVIRYDFRDANGVTNEISDQQIQATEQVLQEWTAASGGTIKFVRDAQAASQDTLNIGVGNMSAMELKSEQGGLLGTSSHALTDAAGSQTSVGTIWLDSSETWTTSSITNSPVGSVDFATVMAHEVGHTLGLEDDTSTSSIMAPVYSGPQNLSGIASAFQNPHFFSASDEDANGVISDNMVVGQLSSGQVATLLDRASVATPSNDAIIAIVDRNGNILGVRAEQDVLNTISNPKVLAFAIDGAASLARTSALFANDTAPLTSRTIEALSQSTILQREVEADPNSTVPTIQGPGFVAPIGLGGHFPANVENTPPVDLFNIEASNRVSTTNPGKGAFNIDPANVPAGKQLNALISYGTASGVAAMADNVQNRGIATLPGGLPIYLNGKLVGGIGVFFPGNDGYATHEQGFEAGKGQDKTQHMNTTQELEAEFIAYAALGGSKRAAADGVSHAVIGTLGGIAPVAGVDLPFGFITLNGISLPLFGSTPGKCGLEDLISQFRGAMGTGTLSGADQPLAGVLPGDTTLGGSDVPPFGYFVTPHVSANSALTVADMTKIIDAGIAASDRVRAAIRLDGNTLNTGAAGVRMTFAITDTTGEVLALYRMEDGTMFSTDVAIAKARNVAYFDSPNLQPQDQVKTSDTGPLIPVNTAFTNRTFRFLAEPRFPSGVDDSKPPQFSILNDAIAAGIDPTTGENITPGTPAAASAFTTVMGHDVFNPGTNFHDPTDTDNQNGVVFFPGSMPLYKNGVLVGGLGVSGDGVNQDDLVTFLAAQGFLPDGVIIKTADETTVNNVRLPFENFGRNPFA